MYILMTMKSIQITFDEDLLKELDATEEVRRNGRSAVFRRAVAEYLRKRRSRQIAEKYERAYGSRPRDKTDLGGWEDEGEWPSE